MNTYETEFFSKCPVNGIRIHYRLKIESSATIPVEPLLAFIDEQECSFHETLADSLLVKFGGMQTLVANHHGVRITTVRSAKC